MLSAVLGLYAVAIAGVADVAAATPRPDVATPTKAATAEAAPDAQALLRRADAALGQAKDGTFTLAVTVVHPDGAKVERTIRVWQRGRDQRMVKFLSPARLRGTGILLPDGERVLVYLPAYGRVREVTGREGGAAFLGTGFSVDELALVRLAPTHTASLTGESDAAWTLRLTPRSPDEHEHAALDVVVRKADDLVTRVTYRDAAGEAYRVLEMGDVREVDGHPIAHRITVSEPESGRRTVATMRDAALDRGIDEGFFTERRLRRRP